MIVLSETLSMGAIFQVSDVATLTLCSSKFQQRRVTLSADPRQIRVKVKNDKHRCANKADDGLERDACSRRSAAADDEDDTDDADDSRSALEPRSAKKVWRVPHVGDSFPPKLAGPIRIVRVCDRVRPSATECDRVRLCRDKV